MTWGLDAVQEQIIQLLLTLTLLCLALSAAVVVVAITGTAARRGVSRRLDRPRPSETFYVGRLEGSRAAVYVVDRDLVRLLFEVSPAPASWTAVSERLARVLAADAVGAAGSSGRGVRRVARRLAKAPRDGFVLERRAVGGLADRSLRRRWACRLRTATAGPGSRLRRLAARRLGQRARVGRPGEPAGATGATRASRRT